MKVLNFMGEQIQLLTEKEEYFKQELTRQFGKKDAGMFALNPSKYKHHFDQRTMEAFRNTYECSDGAECAIQDKSKCDTKCQRLNK